MKLILLNGQIKDVNTNYIFSNQYDTTDGRRIYDNEVKQIIDDIRLGEFYCCANKQGTYDEVAQAIANERAQIHQCDNCWWFNKHTPIENECSRSVIEQNGKKIVREQRVYQISCAHEGKCVHDIEEQPVLFREKHQCFFCEHPEGIPDMTLLKQFMIHNADKYDIVPYWNGDTLSIHNTFKCNKQFGSYIFKADYHYKYFELYNARNRFDFYVDCVAKKFITIQYSSYRVTDKLYTEEYDHTTRSSKLVPICNYDKFAKWFWRIIDDFNNNNNK